MGKSVSVDAVSLAGCADAINKNTVGHSLLWELLSWKEPVGNMWPGRITNIMEANRYWSKKISWTGVTAHIYRMTCNGGPLHSSLRKKGKRVMRGMLWRERGWQAKWQESAVCSLRSEVINMSQAGRVKE